jgi:hypothetical protein
MQQTREASARCALKMHCGLMITYVCSITRQLLLLNTDSELAVTLHRWLGNDCRETTATRKAALKHHLGTFLKGLMSPSRRYNTVLPLAGDTEGQRLVPADKMPREILGCAAGQVQHRDLAISIADNTKPWRINPTPTLVSR